MRTDKIIRFFIGAFVVGSLLGLVGGLVFGGPSSAETAKRGDTDATAPEAEPAEAQPMTPEKARAIGANELGMIMVLEYHKIGRPSTEWTRTPEDFRADIALLWDEGYYPINLRDLATGNIEVPAGKTPVVLTFDDSSPGQYRLLDEGSIDPDSAVGIMQAAVRAGRWVSRASFYVLLDVRPSDHVLFGQPDYQTEKVRNLVSWGYEIGSHTVTHLNLKEASRDESVKQLAVSQATIEKMVGSGYSVDTMSVPFGAYPEDDAILASGTHEDVTYRYLAALEVTGGSSPSPYSTEFEALHIPRIVVDGASLRAAVQRFKDNPRLRYVSDGDPSAVSFPAEVPDELGTALADLGRPTITY
ncbi:MAG: polysaccharide deacetylase family protein [Actinobacteria bacterium]|nr:polysaccharide deacetylase family protein [Actinomycetota bacterium]